MSSFCYCLIIAITVVQTTLSFHSVEAVPFASVNASVSVSMLPGLPPNYLPGCIVNASSLGIDSIDATDLMPFAQRCGAICSICSFAQITFDLSSNSLSSLPNGLFPHVPVVGPESFGLVNIILSSNNFNATSIGNFFPAEPGEASVFGQTPLSLDLSRNSLGPTLPSTFQLCNADSLNLQQCNISFIPPFALNNSVITTLDLSHNNLRNGLQPYSFAGISSQSGQASLILKNTNLRTESLPAGLFHTVQLQSTTLRIMMSNDDLDPKTAATLTPATYLEMMPNAFVNFSNTAFNAPSPGSRFSQFNIVFFTIGDLVSMASPTFLLGNATSSSKQIIVRLASPVIATSLGVSEYCPGPTVARALSTVAVQLINFGLIVTIEGFNLSATAGICQYPAAATIPWSGFALSVPIEPPFLQRSFTSWLGGNSVLASSLAFSMKWTAPLYNIWNPALNVSNWVDVELLKGLKFFSLILPGLPLQFAFPAPDGMFAYLDPSLSFTIDWTQASRFTSGMLYGRQTLPGITTAISVKLSLRLYDGIDPVPLDLFTPVSTMSIVCSSDMSQEDCQVAQTNIASQCPRIVNQVCLSCPDGWFTLFGTNAAGSSPLPFCKRCPAGSRCVSAVSSQPILCSAGYFQPLEAQPQCNSCGYGTYNPIVGSTSPAACVQCSPGRFNSALAGANDTACTECPVGHASPIPGVAACSECPAGYYQNTTGQFSCLSCPKNTYLDQSGSISSDQCQSCPPDSPFSPPGSGSVFSCSTGIVCEDGYYTQVSDSKPCQSLCTLGNYCQGGKAILCPFGSYSNSTGAKKCIPCGTGYFGATVGSSSVLDCTACPRSTYSNAPASGYCSTCNAGMTSSIIGASDASACAATSSPCFTPTDLQTTTSTLASVSQFCPLSAVEPISFSPMLNEGLQTIQQFYASLPKSVSAARSAKNLNRGASLGGSSDNSDSNSTVISDLYRRYPTIRTAPSLRLAAFDSDATLDQWEATQPFADSNTISTGNTAPVLASTQTIAIFVVLSAAAIASWPIYRFIPAIVAWHFDQFSASHQIPDQGALTKQRTQFGSAVTWSFLCVSLLVAILLGTAPNTTVSTALVPPSSLASAGQAKAQFQFTIRAYSSADSVSSYCANVSGGPDISQEGFTSTFISRSLPQGQICAVAVDCSDCGLSAGDSSIGFSFPYSVQLLEWEIWVSAAAPGTWTRRYGVLSQLPGNFISASSQLEFSAIEAYHEDHSRRGDGEIKSGFEIDFLRYTSLTPQTKQTFNSDSLVQLAFVLQKSDIMFTSAVANKLSMIQLLVSIVTSVVSLFTIFAILFRKVEQFGLQGILKASSGLVARDQATGNIIVVQNKLAMPNQSTGDGKACQTCGCCAEHTASHAHPITSSSNPASAEAGSQETPQNDHQKFAHGISPSDAESDSYTIDTNLPSMQLRQADISSTEMTRL